MVLGWNTGKMPMKEAGRILIERHVPEDVFARVLKLYLRANRVYIWISTLLIMECRALAKMMHYWMHNIALPIP